MNKISVRTILLIIGLVLYLLFCGALAHKAIKADEQRTSSKGIFYDSENTKEREKKKAIEYMLNTNKLYQMENDQFFKFQKAFDIAPTFVEKQKYLDSMEMSLKKSNEISRNLKLIYEKIYSKSAPDIGSD